MISSSATTSFREDCITNVCSTATTTTDEIDLQSDIELDKEEEQRRLEQEMIKRRERIERWRAERKLKEQEANRKEFKTTMIQQATAAANVKKWSLEDESEEEDNGMMMETAKKFSDIVDSPPAKFQSLRTNKDDDDDDEPISERMKVSKIIVSAAKAKIEALRNEEEELRESQVRNAAAAVKKQQMEEEKIQNAKESSSERDQHSSEVEIIEDEIDPLDAYMQEVDKEVRKVNHIVTQPKQTQGVVILTGVAKKSTQKKNKGELIEQNIDSLEYSSEEELEDIKDTVAILANKHRKELAKIDHSGVEYASFRKNFYVEVPELARMTPQDVEKYRTELEGIQVKGKGCPKPIKVS